MPWNNCGNYGLPPIRMLSKDFREFIGLLNSHEVEYLVVGGYAVAMHGRPRHTGDLDVWVRRSPENAAKLTRALREFGLGALGLEEADFLKEEQVVKLGYPLFRIDLLTDIDGVDVGTAWLGRKSFTYDGLALNVIGLVDGSQRRQQINSCRKKVFEIPIRKP
jgi:hypothetical protein